MRESCDLGQRQPGIEHLVERLLAQMHSAMQLFAGGRAQSGDAANFLRQLLAQSAKAERQFVDQRLDLIRFPACKATMDLVEHAANPSIAWPSPLVESHAWCAVRN